MLGTRRSSLFSGLQLLLKIRQQDARFSAEHTGGGIQLAQAVHAAELQHQPTRQGNGLAVVAGAGTPQGEVHPMAGAGCRHRQHLISTGDPHAHLRPQALQQGLQDRGIHKGISRQLIQLTAAAQGHQPGRPQIRRELL